MQRLDFHHPQVERLRKYGRQTTYKKGEIILSPSEHPEDIYFIESGLVKTYVIDDLGEQYIHVIYSDDEIFPLAWIIEKEGLDMFYEAITDCSIIRLSKKLFMNAIQTDVDISYSVLCKILDQFVLYTARLDNLEYKSARQRLAYRILFLCRRFGKRDDDGGVILPHITHQELASSVNLARESVSREISRFEKLNLITTHHGRLVVLDLVGLRKQIGTEMHSLFIDDHDYPAWKGV